MATISFPLSPSSRGKKVQLEVKMDPAPSLLRPTWPALFAVALRNGATDDSVSLIERRAPLAIAAS